MSAAQPLGPRATPPRPPKQQTLRLGSEVGTRRVRGLAGAPPPVHRRRLIAVTSRGGRHERALWGLLIGTLTPSRGPATSSPPRGPAS